MQFYKEIEGDLISLALQGEFDVIAHGVNCFCTMRAGIAPQMAKTFGCDSYKLEQEKYKGDINKLGQIEWEVVHQEKEIYGGKWVHYPDEHIFMTGKKLHIVNAYTQYNYGKNHKDGDEKPLDYEALTLCMRKINHQFKGKHIGLPKIGCGLAGGDWSKVKEIIQKELKDCKVTVVKYEKIL